MSYVFSVTFFSTAVHVHLALVAASISHFVTTATKLSCCSLALDLCRPLSRWASLGCHPLSLFHYISLALFSKFLDMTINLSLILYKTRIQEKFPLSVFVLIDSLSLLHKTRVAMRFPVKITSSYIWVAIPVEWVILHWYACGADGRCTVTWLPNFLRWVVYHIFLPIVLRCASLARESSHINGWLKRFFLGLTNHSCLLSQGIIGQLKPARSQKQVLFYLKSFFLNKETHYMLDNFLFQKTWSNWITF